MTGDLITVFGGSGFVGAHVVRALCKRGYRVRVAARRPNLAGDLRVAGDVGQVQLIQANVRDKASVQRAIEGADAVVNLVSVLFQSGRQTFAGLNEQGAEHIGEAAVEAGITRLVHVSAIGADPDARSLYARTKGRGESILRVAIPETTILRPSIVFGPEDEFFNRFADMARFAPALPLISGGKGRMQPVYVGDVAEAVVEVIASPQFKGRTFELGGPKAYTFKELMRFILAEIDRPRLLVPVPGFIAQLMALGFEVAGKLPFVDPPLTRDQVTMLGRDNVESDGDGVGRLGDLGIAPQSIEAIVPTYLERYRRYGQFHESRST